MADDIFIEDPAPGKTATTLRVELMNVEKDIETTKELIERHNGISAPRGQQDLRPMLGEDLRRHEKKQARLLETIIDKSDYDIQQRRRQLPPSSASSQPFQNNRGNSQSSIAGYIRSQQNQNASTAPSHSSYPGSTGHNQQQSQQRSPFVYQPKIADPTHDHPHPLTTTPLNPSRQLDHIIPGARFPGNQPSNTPQHRQGPSEKQNLQNNIGSTFAPSSQAMEAFNPSTSRHRPSSTSSFSENTIRNVEQESSRQGPSPYLSADDFDDYDEEEYEDEDQDEDEEGAVVEQDSQKRLLSQLLGSDASEHEREIEEERMAAKKQLTEERKAKEERQHGDEEFARLLQAEIHSEESAHPTPSSQFMSRSGSGDSGNYGSGSLFGESFGRRESSDSATSLNHPSIERGPSLYGMMPPGTKSALGRPGFPPPLNNSQSHTPHTVIATPKRSHLTSETFSSRENRHSNPVIAQSLPSRSFPGSHETSSSLVVRDSSRTNLPKDTSVIDLTGPSSPIELQEIDPSEFGSQYSTMNPSSRDPFMPSWRQEDDQPGNHRLGATTSSPDDDLYILAPPATLSQQGATIAGPASFPNQLAPPAIQIRRGTGSPADGASLNPPARPFAHPGPNAVSQFNSVPSGSNPPDNVDRNAQLQFQGQMPLIAVPGRYNNASNPNNPSFNPNPHNNSTMAQSREQDPRRLEDANRIRFDPPPIPPILTGPSHAGRHASTDAYGSYPYGIPMGNGMRYHPPHDAPYANWPPQTDGPQNPNQPYNAYGPQNSIQVPNAYGQYHAPHQPQQLNSAGFPDLFWNTGNTIATLGSNLMTGATGLFNNAIDAVGTVYNQYGNTNTPSSLFPSNINTPGESSGTSPFSVSPYGSPYVPGLAGVNPSVNRRHHDALSSDASEDLRILLSNIKPNEDLTTRAGTPDGMVRNLFEHQKVGFAWMKSMESSNTKGGILADDMGLGKTIQAIALMLSNRSTDPDCKTTLIVCPVGLMAQWKKEIATHVKPDPQHHLRVFIAHSDGAKEPFEMMKKYDVVITTYGTLTSEYKRKLESRPSENDEADSSGIGVQADLDEVEELEEDAKSLILSRTNKASDHSMLGADSWWYRIILDEAQNIKNPKAKGSVAVCDVKATYRWCMTGTPMQNGVHELFSLIKFLRIRPYCIMAKFNEDFGRPLKLQKSPDAKAKAMEALRVVLKAFMLRRTKASTIDGRPIINLPEKTAEIHHCVFSQDEKDFYDALENKVQIQYNKYVKAGGVMAHYTAALTLLLRLRQACCHPHLIKDFGAEMPAGVTVDQLLRSAEDLPAEVVVRIAAEEAFECPACFDGVQNPVILYPCGHPLCSECFGKFVDPVAREINDERPARENPEFLCPLCRGVFDKRMVTNLHSFNKVHRPEVAAEAEEQEEEDSDSDSDSENESDAEDDDDSLADFVVDDDEVEVEAEVGEGAEPPTRKAAGKRGFSGRDSTSKKVKLGKERAKAKKPRVTLAQLKKDSLRSADAKRRYLKRLRKTWETSAKIEKTVELLTGIAERNFLVDKNAGQLVEKTIIFSQFTSLLDLLEIPISANGWGYRRYDGTMPSAHRNQAVLDFEQDEECTIMLISLKAGNAGLNLTAASQVILFEPFWNPFVEDQAVDRAYRIGQDRIVAVHRILVAETVEDRIQTLQTQKRELIEAALDESASQRVGRLDEDNMAFLFGVSRR